MVQGLPEEDVRAMVRLVADVASLHSDQRSAKRSLMNGLKELIGAECWVWTLAYVHPEKRPAYVSVDHGGFSQERFVRLLTASDHPDMKDLMAPLVRAMETSAGQVTLLRQEIDPDNRFLTTGAYPLWIAADIAPIILSARTIHRECLSLVALYRGAQCPLFSEREKKIAHILLHEVPWLHAIGWPEDFGAPAPALSPRRRLVLNLLLEGHSRKSIAHHLALSVHTVSDYVKDVYAALGVKSHSELMRRFGGGVPTPIGCDQHDGGGNSC
jgi:DNA-binding CsgD family transcriptional regulator